MASSYRRAKLKDSILISLFKLESKSKVKDIKNKIENDFATELNQSSLVNSLRNLENKNYVEKVGWGKYKITDDGKRVVSEKIPENPELFKEEEDKGGEELNKEMEKPKEDYKIMGLFMLQIKVDKEYEKFYEGMVNFEEPFPLNNLKSDKFEYVADEKREFVSLKINKNMPKNDCIEILMGFFTPLDSDKKYESLFDLKDDKLRKNLIFSLIARTYCEYILPVYKKLHGDQDTDICFQDLKIYHMGLADYGENIFYTNKSLDDRLEKFDEGEDENLYSIFDFLNKRWKFRLNEERRLMRPEIGSSS